MNTRCPERAQSGVQPSRSIQFLPGNRAFGETIISSRLNLSRGRVSGWYRIDCDIPPLRKAHSGRRQIILCISLLYLKAIGTLRRRYERGSDVWRIFGGRANFNRVGRRSQYVGARTNIPHLAKAAT